MTTFDEQKQKAAKEEADKKVASRVRWLPFKRYWLLYTALAGTGALSIFAGIYLGLNPNEKGLFDLTFENIIFALYYGIGFLVTAEGATLFWETKLVYHDVNKEGKANNWQLNTAKVALGLSIAAVIVTGLAAADFIAVWRGNFSAFTQVQEWAQGWVVWAIPVLFVFHAACAILYWYHSAEAALDRWKNQNRRQTQVEMSEVEAEAWIAEYRRISPELAKQKGRAMARQAALHDFYAEEEKLGLDLNNDGFVGSPQKPRPEAPRTPVQASFASQTVNHIDEAEKPAVNPHTGQEQKD
jgi:hypothetical protein